MEQEPSNGTLSGVIPNQLNGYGLSVAIPDFKTVLLMV
jgi:hypothetical protein